MCSLTPPAVYCRPFFFAAANNTSKGGQFKTTVSGKNKGCMSPNKLKRPDVWATSPLFSLSTPRCFSYTPTDFVSCRRLDGRGISNVSSGPQGRNFHAEIRRRILRLNAAIEQNTTTYIQGSWPAPYLD